MRDTSPGEDEDDLVGRVLEGRYQILERIREGGMGAVYLARHTLIERKVALKVLRPAFAADPKQVERFVNEGRAAGMLGHPHIVESTDFGFTPSGAPFLVLELLHGRTLDEEIAAVGQLSIERAARIATQIASAAGAAHAAGIIHRDLKSSNIFLVERSADHVKVLDFGVSKFSQRLDETTTDKGRVLGTPLFMAPEQITHAHSVDARADVYALGVILFHMLAGRLPFEGKSVPMVLVSVTTEVPPPLRSLRPDVPNVLAELVDRLLAKAPEHRLQSMVDVERQLAPFTSSALQRTEPDGEATLESAIEAARTATEEIEASRNIQRVAAAVGALLFAAGVAWFALTMLRWRSANDAPANVNAPRVFEGVETVEPKRKSAP